MRLVSHPNIVDLKAFFYSNGDKVQEHGQTWTTTIDSPCPHSLLVRDTDFVLVCLVEG